MNYRRIGNGSNILIALHGFGGSLDDWSEIGPLLESRYTVYTPDLPGFGLSDKPKDFSYSVTEQAENIADFVQHIEKETAAESITLIGHSYGGSVSLAVWLVLKDRQDFSVKKLVLIDALAFPKKVKFPAYISILRVPVINHLVLDVLSARKQARIALRNVIHKQDLVTPALVCRYAQFLDQPGEHRALIRTVAGLGKPREIERFTASFQYISVPTLIMWGKYDRLIPPTQATLIHESLTNSQPPSFVDAGHLPQVEVPGETARLIVQFIER
jgi:pimeloyl-ACP methyl ester carboxylesterase